MFDKKKKKITEYLKAVMLFGVLYKTRHIQIFVIQLKQKFDNMQKGK